MSVRNRKEEFLNIAQKPKFVSAKFQNPAVDKNGELLLIFLNKVNSINHKFDFLDNKVAEVLNLQSAILEFSENDEGLYGLYDNIKRAIVDLVGKITEIEKWFDPKKFTGSETELRIYNTQLMSLKTKIASFITRYYSIQEEYKSKCKARVKRQAQIAGADISKTSFEEALGLKTELFMNAVFPDFDMTHHYLFEIKKRHANFLHLEKAIAELHELFFDLALVVQVDFALLDRIDKHSTFVDRLVIDGLKNVKSYRRSIRLSRLKKYMAIGCLVFFVCVMVLVVYQFIGDTFLVITGLVLVFYNSFEVGRHAQANVVYSDFNVAISCL